jgi:hypothetical protein
MSTILAKIASKSNPSKTYTITLSAEGVVYCDCPAWRYQRISPADRCCKHTVSFSAKNLGAAEEKAVVSKSIVGSHLGKATERRTANADARAAHRAMTRGTVEEAKAAAEKVASIKGASKNLRALADAFTQ